jgi:hypothetical protein
MTIKILKKTVNIELCHQLFKQRLYYDEFERCHIKLRSGQGPANFEDVIWTQRDRFWMYMPDPWQENAFGLSDKMPPAWEEETVVCAIDFNPGVNGAFGRDEFGGILAVHTGAPLPGKDSEAAKFWQEYQGPRIENAGHPYAVMAHLGALDVPGQFRVFLDEMARIRGI